MLYITSRMCYYLVKFIVNLSIIAIENLNHYYFSLSKELVVLVLLPLLNGSLPSICMLIHLSTHVDHQCTCCILPATHCQGQRVCAMRFSLTYAQGGAVTKDWRPPHIQRSILFKVSQSGEYLGQCSLWSCWCQPRYTYLFLRTLSYWLSRHWY